MGELIKVADAVLNEAKAQGRNKIFPDTLETLRAKLVA
jgi:PleD family two-component response regulator